MDQYQLPLFFVGVYARAVVSPWDAPAHARICISIRVIAHQRATLSTMFVYTICVYTHICALFHRCYIRTRVGLQLKPLHARSFRAHLIIDRALLLRSGLSRGGSTCWITLLIIIDALSSCIRELSHFLPRLLCGIRASNSVFVLS